MSSSSNLLDFGNGRHVRSDVLALKVSRSEAKLFALAIVRDPEYRENLLQACRRRTVAPAIEALLMAYAWGKPVERVELAPAGAFSELEELSTKELAERARLLASALDEIPPTEAEIKAAQEQTDVSLQILAGEAP